MSDKPESTRAQNIFLRAFRDNPAGPPPQDWPAPAVLRRWLTNDAFRQTLFTLRDALRVEADFHIASAANAAARSIRAAVIPSSTSAATGAPPTALAEPADLARQLKSLTDLLRLAHVRQRFADEPAATPAAPDAPADAPQAAAGPSNDRSYEAILNDPGRLKAYMLLCTAHGTTRYDPFLSAFPEDRAAAAESARKWAAMHAARQTPT